MEDFSQKPIPKYVFQKCLLAKDKKEEEEKKKYIYILDEKLD